MKKYIITEKELKILNELKTLEGTEYKDHCPFCNQWWDFNCPYNEGNYCEKSKFGYGGIKVNPGNGDAFCHKLINLYYACKDLVEKDYQDLYIEYVDGKIDIGEVPFTYDQWLQAESELI